MVNRNLVIGTLGPIVSATLSGGPVAPNGPLTNLKQWQAHKQVVLTDPARRFIDIDHGSAYAARLVAVAFVLAPAGLQFRHLAADTPEDLADPPYASAWQELGGGEDGFAHRGGMKHDWHWNPAAPSYRYRRIEFSDATFATDDRLVLSKLIVTRGFQPKFNKGLGHSPPGLVDPSFPVSAVEGQSDQVPRRKHDITDFTLYHLSRAEALGEIRALYEEVGTTAAFMTVFDPLANDYRQSECIYGRFTELRQPRKQTQLEYSVPMSIREDLP